MEELALWESRLKLHRPLEPLLDEEEEGVRHTSFACAGDDLGHLLAHYDAAIDDASFHTLGRTFEAGAFSLSAERSTILLTVTCTVDSTRTPLLTFMADNCARRRSSSPLPPTVLDAWGLTLVPVPGSTPDTFQDRPRERSYRFTLPTGAPSEVAAHFRALALSHGFVEADFVASEGAIALTFRRGSQQLEVSAWVDPSTAGSIYAVGLRR
ncbi:MAG: hypothetical protein IPF92_25245 [Myxococcales bacterium]|nr:hypothetical protein [Myxococcales bacterium]MBL0195774.1 hypothetical protein [Myxococcales bacterium]HQY60033.1 hypothetical protein [Polyangiaceae bacterium]